MDTSNFVLKTNLANLKTEVGKLDIDKLKNLPNNGLEKTSALIAEENKIPDTSHLVKKTDYNAKVTDIEKKITDHNHNKYITTTEFNKFATDAVNARLLQANLVKRTDFDNKLSDRNRKIVSNKTKNISTAKELSYFHGKNYFDEDGNQNYYIFEPISKYLKVAYVNDINYILSWKSRGLNDIKIESIKTNNYQLNRHMDLYGMHKIRIKFNGSSLN